MYIFFSFRVAKKWGLQQLWSRDFASVYKDALKDQECQHLLSVMKALEACLHILIFIYSTVFAVGFQGLSFHIYMFIPFIRIF